ncbi:MAG: ATP-binding protein [Planctomycetes bacterium]|nr:ATP-binding protein [Planctomycetota bacterium]
MDASDLSVRVRFRAVRGSLARVCALVETLLASDSSGSFTREDVAEILLAVQEAVSNASRHAAREKREAEVELLAWTRKGRCCVRLRDWGEAFDPAAVPAPDPERPKEHGYGLYLLRRTMDRVRWSRRGRCNVLLLERRGGGGPGVKLRRRAVR